MSDYKRYLITEKAGPWVAGTRNRGVGSELRLTAAQAEHELRLGSIIEAAAQAAPQPMPEAAAEPEAPADSEGEVKSAGKAKLRPRKRAADTDE